MTRIVTPATILASLLLTVFATTAADPLPQAPSTALRWQEVPQEAVARARLMQRPLLVYVTAHDCGYCRKLERTTWSNPQVAAHIAENFVPLKLDAQAYPQLVETLGVRGYPAVIIISLDGRELARVNGFVEPHHMLMHLNSALSWFQSPRASRGDRSNDQQSGG